MAIKINVTTRDGTEREITASEGDSLMQTIRWANIDEMTALCGGFCSCATCHVYIDAPWIDVLDPMSENETGLLEGSSSRQPNSRLACQIPVSPALDGMHVTIAPE
jgi:2Fe-2S ferredoxin